MLFHKLVAGSLTASDFLYAWGNNSLGQLGLLGTSGNSTVPKPIINPWIGTERSWAQITAGASHNLALDSYGILYGWGDNVYGQLGDGTTVNKSTPVKIGISSWIAVGVGDRHSLGITVANTLWAWGDNRWGQVGNGHWNFGQVATTEMPSVDRSAPVQIFGRASTASPASWAQISITDTSSLAIRSDGLLFAWGSNNVGQLGDGTTISKLQPVQIGAGSSWIQVSTGEGTAAIRADGALFAWGLNTAGQIGDGTTNNKSIPVQIGQGSSWTKVSTSKSHTIAIRSDGALFAWGLNATRQLGDGTTDNKSSPVQISPGSSWNTVSAGASHSAAIDINNNLFTWGSNVTGQIGDDTTSNRSTPLKIGTSSWRIVSAGASHTSAVRLDYALFVWGSNATGQLGDGTTVNKSSPVQIGTGSWSIVSAGANHTGAIRADSTLWMWGQNTSGQLGDGATVNNSVPVQIGTNSWVAISAVTNRSAAIKADNMLWLWGNNTDGQIGNNTVINTSSPVQVLLYSDSLETSFTKIGSGYGTHNLAVSNTNKIYTWGINTTGQLGDGTTSNTRFIPRTIIFGTPATTESWSQISEGSLFTVAIRNDGTLWSWGTNTVGQLGLGNTINRFIPAQVGYSSWIFVSAGISHASAIRIDGALFTWGLNTSGQLGNGTTVNSLSPVQVGSSSWSKVSAGATHTTAIQLNNTLYAWGSNTTGQLGDSSIVNRSSPVLITSVGSPLTTTSWTRISAGTGHTLAIRSDGTLFTWGTNTTGQLGDNTAASKLAPVQLGTSSWTQVSAGASHSTAITINNTLFVWGSNTTGQLGDGTTVNKSTPVQIDALNIPLTSTGYSVAFDGTGDYLTLPGDESSLVMGTGDFTIEMWVNIPSFTVERILYDTIQQSDPSGIGRFAIRILTSNVVQIFSLAGTGLTSGGTLVPGVWNHIAYSRQSASGRLYVNGVQVNTTYSDNNNYNVGINRPVIGINGFDSSSSPMLGYISNLRVVSGTAVYTTNFTPSTTPLTAISGTSLLTCQNTTVIDNGGNLFSISRGGDVVVSAVNPFGYSASNNVISVSAGASHTTAIRSDGALFTWGSNVTGQLGNGLTVNRLLPTQIGTSSWSIVSAGASHTSAVAVDNYLFAWGSNVTGQLGDSTAANKSSPVMITSIGSPLTTTSWNQISVGEVNSLAIRSDGALFTWGTGTFGSLGDSTTAAKLAPVKLGSSSWTLVAAGGYHSAAIRIDGALFMWGYNNFGQLGDGTTNDKSSPVRIGTSSWSMVNTGIASHTTAIRSDGALFAWGLGTNGQLGDNTTDSKSSPVRIGTSSWSAVAGGLFHSAAITVDNFLYTWGDNTSGALGDTTLTGKSSPVLIQSVGGVPLTTTSWNQISTGLNHTLAIRSDGALFTWGSNTLGQLGDGTTGYKAVPFKINNSSWSKVSAGSSHSVALTANNVLFAWGLNTLGQLGDGTTVNKSSPIQIGTSSWSSVSAGASHTTAISLAGSLFAWGSNVTGRLGDGTTINRSSPVSIALNCTSVSAGGNHTTALRRTLSARLTLDNPNAYGTGLSDYFGTSVAISGNYAIVGAYLEDDASGPSSGKAYIFNVTTGALVRTLDNPSIYSTGAGDYFGISVAISGNYAIVGARLENPPSGTNAGIAYIFDVTAATGVVHTLDNPNAYGTGLSDYFGTSVAISGNYAIVGAPGEDYAGGTDSGKAYIFNVTTGNRVRTLDSPDASPSDDFGTSVAISGNYAIVGVSIEDATNTNSGRVYIYDVTTGAVLTLDNPNAYGASNDDNFGYSVGISGNYAIVGAYREDDAGGTDSGKAYIFNVTTGALVRTLDNPNPYGTSAGDNFGYSVGISGNYAIVGAPGEDEAGALSGNAYVYNVATGEVLLTLNNPNAYGTSLNDGFGDSVAISGNYAIVGAYLEDDAGGTSSGKSYIYNITNTYNALFAWGSNVTGQLGDGTTVNKSSPVQIGSSSWSIVRAGASHTAGISASQIYTWGSNVTGQLGDGTTVNKLTPMAVSSFADTLFATGHGVVFPGTGHLSLASATGAPAAFAIATSTTPFTIECWLYPTAAGGVIFSNQYTGVGNTVPIVLSMSNGTDVSTVTGSNIGLGWYSGAAWFSAAIASPTISLNIWSHVAAVFTGSTTKIYINGIDVTKTATPTPATTWGVTGTSGADEWYIGKRWDSTAPVYFNGLISNFRFVNGTAVYTANFVPSTIPLTAIANTVLLTCQNNTFIDNSTNAFAITNTGAIITKINPFGVTPIPVVAVSAGSNHTTALISTANLKIILNNPNAYGTIGLEQFGYGLAAISGNYAIVGAPYENDENGTYSGKAYVYNITTGALLHTLNNPNDYGTSTNDYFGISVAISDNYAIVGAYFEDDAGGTNSGKAYIFNVTNGAWVRTLDNPNAYNTSDADYFGTSVAISGNYAIVGAADEDDAGGTDSGKAYIFNVTTGAVLTLDNPNAYGTSSNDGFGESVAISGNYAIVGAPGEDDAGGTLSGKAYVYNVATGEMLLTLDNPNAYGTSSNDGFGESVAISGNYAIVGAYLEDDAGGTNSGKAYIFNVTTGARVRTLDNPNAYNTSDADYFGISVAISDNYAIVGAAYEDDAGGTGSGKAYIFNVTTGVLLRTLDNPNAYGTSSNDGFGESVAISGNYAIVGASLENEAGGTSSGKAYIFDITDSALFAWGNNTSGQLGDGTTVNKSTPIQISTSSWSIISAGTTHTGAIRADGTLWLWGENSSGILGDGTLVNKSSPVIVVGGINSWTAVSAGYYYTAGIFSSELYTWGRNDVGQLGDGTTVNKSTPVNISSLISGTTIISVKLAQNHSIALNSNYSLLAWGSNQFGGLGDGTTINSLLPIKIGSSSWSSIDSGSNISSAIRADSTLWVWGRSEGRPIGDGTLVNKSSPVIVIGGLNSWSIVSAGASHTAGLFASQLYTWGSNVTGQIGDGTTVNKSAPVQIGAFNAPVYTAGHGVYFDGNGDYATGPGNVAFSFGTGAFTIEGWVNPAVYGPTVSCVIYSNFTTIAGNEEIALVIMTAGTLRLTTWNTAIVTTTSLIPLYTWTHVAATFDGTTYRLFINGVLAASGTGTQTLSRSGPCVIGASTVASFSSFNGYISNLRVVKGTAVYTSGFTPSTTPLTAITNTVLLTCQNSTIIDNSSNSFALTVFGNTVSTNLNPFGNSTSTTAISVSVGASHTTILRSDYALYSWGSNVTGQLGNGTTVNRLLPIQIGTSSWSIVSAGASHTGAIRADSTLWLWGSNALGQLGDGTIVNKSSPVIVIGGLNSWTAVSAGASHTAGLFASQLYTWGSNVTGQIGDGTTVNKSAPVLIGAGTIPLTSTGYSVVFDGTSDYLTAPANAAFTFGTSDFTVEGWIYLIGTTGTLYDSRTTSGSVNVLVHIFSSILYFYTTGAARITGPTLSSNQWHHIALARASGTTKMYLNGVQVGSSYTDTNSYLISSPYIGTQYNGSSDPLNGYISNLRVVKGTAVYTSNFTPSTTPLTAITNTVLLTCQNAAVIDNSTNNFAITQFGSIISSNVNPFGYFASTNILSVSAGASHTSAVRADYTLFVWGSNVTGQLGNGSTVNRSTPIQLGTSSWSITSAGSSHTGAIRADGTLWLWGGNAAGQLGDGTTVNKSSPVQIGTSSWSIVTAGINYTGAITSSGALWNWGDNSQGQLGNNSVVNTSSPVLVATIYNPIPINNISIGSSHTAIIDNSGILRMWGNNATGQLGDGTTVNKPLPNTIIGSNYSIVSAGASHTIALQLDNTLWAWGGNSVGQLGDSTTINKSSPAKLVIFPSASWQSASAGLNHSAARYNITLYTWGLNSSGQIGDGTTLNKSTPLAIGVFSTIAAGGSHTFGK